MKSTQPIPKLFISEGTYTFLPEGEQATVHVYGLQTCLCLVLKSERGAFVTHIDTPFGNIDRLIASAITQLGAITYAKIFGGSDDAQAKKDGSYIIFKSISSVLKNNNIEFKRDNKHWSTADKLSQNPNYHCDVKIVMNQGSGMKIGCNGCSPNPRNISQKKMQYLIANQNNPRHNLDPTNPSEQSAYKVCNNGHEFLTQTPSSTNRSTTPRCTNRSMLFTAAATTIGVGIIAAVATLTSSDITISNN